MSSIAPIRRIGTCVAESRDALLLCGLVEAVPLARRHGRAHETGRDRVHPHAPTRQLSRRVPRVAEDRRPSTPRTPRRRRAHRRRDRRHVHDRPPPACSIAGIAAREHTNTLRRLTCSTLVPLLLGGVPRVAVVALRRCRRCSPARRAGRSSSSAAATASCAASGRRDVADHQPAVGAERAHLVDGCAPRGSSRSTTTTRAPSRANRNAVARPNPDAPPVTMATLPSSRPTSASRFGAGDHEVVEHRFPGHAPVVDELPRHVGRHPAGVVVVVAVHPRMPPHELLVLGVDAARCRRRARRACTPWWTTRARAWHRSP